MNLYALQREAFDIWTEMLVYEYFVTITPRGGITTDDRLCEATIINTLEEAETLLAFLQNSDIGGFEIVTLPGKSLAEVPGWPG